MTETERAGFAVDGHSNCSPDARRHIPYTYLPSYYLYLEKLSAMDFGVISIVVWCKEDVGTTLNLCGEG